MSEVMKDSAIKLFGKTIILLSENRQSSFTSSTSIDSKDESGGEFTCIKDDQYDTSSEIDDETNTIQVEAPSPKDSNTPEETTLKKPDKILPCPRCNSTDTKFCYYNNYNVNQPRYFCRNCQRYWTSGGTMRNVPVGSGRRKNKNTIVPSFGHIIVSDALQTPINGFLISPNSGFYPATTYWNVPAVSTTTSPVSCLGKHSREGDMVKASNSGNLDGERSVLIPKTLRIHDPSEAAKSSIWSTLGIKYEKSGPLSGTGLFKAFDSKGDHRRSIDNRTVVLHTNPAALSRSVHFHESA